MEARTWQGENAVNGVHYNPLPLHPQTEEERERTMHYSLNLVNRREREERHYGILKKGTACWKYIAKIKESDSLAHDKGGIF